MSYVFDDGCCPHGKLIDLNARIAEAVAAERARIKREIAVIRDDPALDGVMGLGWDAIEQIVGQPRLAKEA